MKNTPFNFAIFYLTHVLNNKYLFSTGKDVGVRNDTFCNVIYKHLYLAKINERLEIKCIKYK